jgi:4-amino-4-deoxy-L-arabinose transferase-like glycosyltransferase
VESGTLKVFEPLNFLAEGRIAPRSIAAVGGYLVPGSFFGLILIYGWLAKIFTLNIVWFLTPFFAGAAVFCFYKILGKIFDRRIAFWSALLLLAHPVFWYYASRGFFPNILFVSLLIIGFYFLVCRSGLMQKNPPQSPFSKGGSKGGFILAGLFFGLALTVRLSEAIWVGGVLFLLWIIYRKQVAWSRVILFLIFALLPFLPILAYNQIFYDNYFRTAYTLGGGAALGEVRWFSSVVKLVFPFGLEVKNVLKFFSTYFVGMFWWFAVPLTFGLIVFLKKLIAGKLDKKVKTYLLLGGLASFFLFCYYGSWFFYDNPAKEASIGTSYVRYWLPAYIFSLPFVAFAMIKLVEFVNLRKKILALVLCLIYLLFGIQLTFLDKNDGLAYVSANVKSYAEIARTVNSIIPSDAVIIVDRADKIFFPEHRIIWPLRDDGTYALIPKLVKILPLYYYGLPLTEKEIDLIYQNKLDPEVVRMEKIGNFGAESLYKFIEVKK